MQLSVLTECENRGHEQVAYFNYPEVGLKAIVAIHSTVLGSGLGGVRMRAYADEAQALEDVMRLSEGMTYKNSIAGLDLGGGKACIIADPRMTRGRKELFEKFGECIQGLGGRYITAEDMGTSVEDIEFIHSRTEYVTGKRPNLGGSGDPSPWTAYGVFLSIKAACGARYGSEDLAGKRVAIQGIGHVGLNLLQRLTEAGVQVTICDMNDAHARKCAKEFGADVVPPEAIYDVRCDIYSPCAVGQTVNIQTIPRMHCEIIAGAANNQLSDPSVYSLLAKRDIMYCPDFVINAGGVISVAGELAPGGWSEGWVKGKVEKIYTTIKALLAEVAETKQPSETVALKLAKQRIQAARDAKR